MTFVQIIDCKTDKVDDLSRLMDTWIEQTKGKRTATHSVVGADRADPHHVVEIVEFPSYEEAMRNSNLPETDRIFREMVALCDEPPKFTDLEVVRDEQLNKEAARRFFEVIAHGDSLDGLDDLVAADYYDHDPGNETDNASLADLKREVSGYRAAFDFTMTVESQLADGDQVANRWRMRGTHIADYEGVPATGKVLEVTGTTTMRFKDGRIQESWWNWDNLGMMRQLGLVQM